MSDLFDLPPADLKAELGHDLAVLPTGWPEAGLKPHPFAAINRMMTADEFAELKASVRERGLLEKIVIFEDKVLDGRNRFLAGIAVGRFVSNVDWRNHPDFIEFGSDRWDGDRGTDALSFVWDMEVRRHRSARDTALAAARYLKLISEVKPTNETEKTAKLRLPTQAEIAKRHGISERLVHSALMLLDRAEPEIVQAVEQGKLSLTDGAEIIAKLDQEEQRTIARVIADNPDRKAVKDVVRKAAAPKSPDLPAPLSRTDLALFAEAAINLAHLAADKHKGAGASISADAILKFGRDFGIIHNHGEFGFTPSALLALGKLRDMPQQRQTPEHKADTGPQAPPLGGEWMLKIGGLNAKHKASIAVFHEEDETFSIAVGYDFGSRSASGPFTGSYPAFADALKVAARQVRASMDDLAGATDSVTSDAAKASAYDGVTWLDKRLAEWGISLAAEAGADADEVAGRIEADRARADGFLQTPHIYAKNDILAAYPVLVAGQGDLKGKHTRETAKPILEAGVAAGVKRAQIADDIGHSEGTVSGWCARLGLQNHDRLKESAAKATVASAMARRNRRASA